MRTVLAQFLNRILALFNQNITNSAIKKGGHKVRDLNIKLKFSNLKLWCRILEILRSASTLAKYFESKYKFAVKRA